MMIDIFVEFLERCGEKTFTVKDGDTDIIYKENVLLKLNSVSVNSRGQYVVDETLEVNLDSWTWLLYHIKKHFETI